MINHHSFRVEIHTEVLKIDICSINPVNTIFVLKFFLSINTNNCISIPRSYSVYSVTCLYQCVFAFREKALKSTERKKQLDLFIKGYNQAVDSINRNGFVHYSDLFRKYCDADLAAVKALPKLKFDHAGKPKTVDFLRPYKK